jgi:hypothetical protein
MGEQGVLGQDSPRPARSRTSAWCPDAALERRQVDFRVLGSQLHTRPQLRPAAAARHTEDNRPEVIATKVAANATKIRSPKTVIIPMTKLLCT